MKLLLGLALAVALFGFVGMGGCDEVHPFGGGNAEELSREARSLLPAGARVRSEKGGDCVELADYPSCWRVTWESELDHDARVRAVQTSGENAGWHWRTTSDTRVSTWIQFDKGELFATVVVHFPECRETRDPEACVDWVHVLD